MCHGSGCHHEQQSGENIGECMITKFPEFWVCPPERAVCVICEREFNLNDSNECGECPDCEE
mgnify:CR=1 FL=1